MAQEGAGRPLEPPQEARRSNRLEPTQGAMGKTIWHHRREECSAIRGGNDYCPFHRPSLHAMIEEPMLMRETGLIERVCIHGIGHADPDSAAFLDRVYDQPPGTWATHGCDRCCQLAHALVE